MKPCRHDGETIRVSEGPRGETSASAVKHPFRLFRKTVDRADHIRSTWQNNGIGRGKKFRLFVQVPLLQNIHFSHFARLLTAQRPHPCNLTQQTDFYWRQVNSIKDLSPTSLCLARPDRTARLGSARGWRAVWSEASVSPPRSRSAMRQAGFLMVLTSWGG